MLRYGTALLLMTPLLAPLAAAHADPGRIAIIDTSHNVTPHLPQLRARASR
ncbi:hypothetical protein [Methyloceanibacter marginalis]|uniref:hypothetical protein n=1 Tax=Methyloceanibacter marginalis TaxID=1774971 RepID=UPI00130120A4|nr:hypothetical protein [Methyloceanibacter marginalis]